MGRLAVWKWQTNSPTPFVFLYEAIANGQLVCLYRTLYFIQHQQQPTSKVFTNEIYMQWTQIAIIVLTISL